MLYKLFENASLNLKVIIGELIIVPEQTLKKSFQIFICV